MAGAIEVFMSADHARLDRLLDQADGCGGGGGGGSIDAAAYAELRSGLLLHIAREEKVLLPFARGKRGGEPLPIARTLRVDHGQIARLLVPTPTPDITGQLRQLLAKHNALEEGALRSLGAHGRFRTKTRPSWPDGRVASSRAPSRVARAVNARSGS